MFGIGPVEFIIFLVIVLVAVGPEKLPTFMRTIGRGLREVRRAGREFRDAIGIDEMMREDPLRLREPLDKPVPIPRSDTKGPDDTQALDHELTPENEVKPSAKRPSATPPAIPKAARTGADADADADAGAGTGADADAGAGTDADADADTGNPSDSKAEAS